jgi:hypothetical protein
MAVFLYYTLSILNFPAQAVFGNFRIVFVKNQRVLPFSIKLFPNLNVFCQKPPCAAVFLFDFQKLKLVFPVCLFVFLKNKFVSVVFLFDHAPSNLLFPISNKKTPTSNKKLPFFIVR